MEQMPYQVACELPLQPPAYATTLQTTDWQMGLPRLIGSQVTLRELRVSDAPSLFAALTTEQVSRFISPPPSTVDGFERFIAWTHRQRAAGEYVCFAIVPNGSDRAAGIFQIRALKPAFGTAEWSFALASEYWGTGMFVDGARLALAFAFDVLGIHRLEARSAIRNGRGNGALRKIGAVQEAVLHRSFLRNGEYLDQALWAVLSDEWRAGSVARDGQRCRPRDKPLPAFIN
jgi:[ribosomal protein S5]-alanine N-acetyltransferase